MQVTEQMCDEVENIRETYIQLKVARRINHRNGDVTTEQVETWTQTATADWNAGFPALARLLSDGTEGKEN